MKNSKNTKSFCLSILTNCCQGYFFLSFPKMCKLRTTLYLVWSAGPPGLQLYGWWKLARFGSMWLEIFSQMKFITFLVCPTSQASSFHIISSLFSHFCLFQNAILHKMLKLGLWNFKPFFSECSFYWLQHFYSGSGYLFKLIFESETISCSSKIYIISHLEKKV